MQRREKILLNQTKSVFRVRTPPAVRSNGRSSDVTSRIGPCSSRGQKAQSRSSVSCASVHGTSVAITLFSSVDLFPVRQQQKKKRENGGIRRSFYVGQHARSFHTKSPPSSLGFGNTESHTPIFLFARNPTRKISSRAGPLCLSPSFAAAKLQFVEFRKLSC